MKPSLFNTLIIICGPTAVGKTSVSVDIAKALDCEIISADSRQFYRELKIGAAPPDELQMKTVHHHFIGHLSITEQYNASRFETEVLRLLENYFVANKYMLMVGGSGLYIDAVCKGIDDLPDPEHALRNSLKEEYKKSGLENLLSRLKELDPEYYKTVDKNNPNRILRALEVCLETGNSYSSLRSNSTKKRSFSILKIGLSLPKYELIERIDNRIDHMIASGLVEEASGLIHHQTLNALNTVGYKEIFNFLQGNISLEEAIEKIKTNTRRYAKRQMTWFKKDNSINWFHPSDTSKILRFIREKTA